MPVPPIPYDFLPEVPSFEIQSNDVAAVSYTHLTLPTSDLV